MSKRTKTLLIILAAAAAAALVIGAVLAIASLNREPFVGYENSIARYYADEEGATRFIVNSELLENKLAGSVDSFLSCDGTVGIARAGTGLYRVDKDGVLKIYPAGVQSAVLSLDNRLIVFATATELHIYDHKTGELTDLKPEGVKAVPYIAVSPDGNTVGYTVKNADGAYEAFAYENGESRRLTEGACIVGVGNRAAFYYYVTPGNMDLHYVSGSSDRIIGEKVSGLIEFDRDLEEVLFDMNGSTYFSEKGSAARAIVEGASVYPTNSECESKQGGEECVASVKDADTLFDAVFYRTRSSSADEDARTAYDLWFVDSLKRPTELVKGAYQFALVDGRRKVACLVDNTVYVLSARDPAIRTAVCSNAYSFNASPDGKEFYCVAYDLGLYYTRVGERSKLLDSNVIFSALAPDGRCLYLKDYNRGGSLYSVKAGGEPVKIADDAAQINVLPKAVLYYTSMYEDSFGNMVYDVYSSSNGLDFELAVSSALAVSEE